MSTEDRHLTELVELGESIVERAKRGGATVAECMLRSGAELSAKVRLGEPLTEGRLVVRLPAGWSVMTRQKPGQTPPRNVEPNAESTPAQTAPAAPRTLTVIDYDRQGRERRKLRITQEQQTERKLGPEYYLERVLNAPPNIELEPQPFPMLGTDDAVLVPLMIDRRHARLIEQYGLSEGGLYACAVLSDGLAVTIQLTGDGAYGPSSRQLLRLVADNMRLADGAPATSSATAPAR